MPKMAYVLLWVINGAKFGDALEGRSCRLGLLVPKGVQFAGNGTAVQ